MSTSESNTDQEPWGDEVVQDVEENGSRTERSRLREVRERVRAMPARWVEHQVSRPLPEDVQDRVPEWMQTRGGRAATGAAAVVVMVLWVIVLMFLAGLL